MIQQAAPSLAKEKILTMGTTELTEGEGQSCAKEVLPLEVVSFLFLKFYYLF